MHTNEQFLTKMTAEQITQLKAEALQLDSNPTHMAGTGTGWRYAHTRALDEQLARLGL